MMTEPDTLPIAPFTTGIAAAQALDAADELAPFRNRFLIADPQLIYLDGNSLGRLPRATPERLQTAITAEWGQQLVRSWNRGWFQAPERLGEKIARLIGAAPGQVIACDSTSVNLFKLAMAALVARPDRSQVVSDDLNFPSDLYILQGCLPLLGDTAAGPRRLLVIASPDGVHADLPALERAIDERTALVTLSQVAFKSAYLYPAAELTAQAHRAGALVLWDLSHSAGVVPIELDAWGVDLAVGCTYKYLNGGPGAPAYLYVRRELQEQLLSPIAGWFGQQAPFAFDLMYTPAAGIARYLAGTPPVLSLLAIEPGLDLLLEAGVERLRRKSGALSKYLIFLYDAVLAPLGFSLGTPRAAGLRGSHVSLRHSEGYRLNRVLIEELGVLPDFRAPDHLRFGLAPLYTSFQDVWHAVDRLRRAVVEKRYLNYSSERSTVT